MKEKGKGFVNVRIKESDHERLIKRVTHEVKIYHIITEALDALEARGSKK